MDSGKVEESAPRRTRSFSVVMSAWHWRRGLRLRGGRGQERYSDDDREDLPESKFEASRFEAGEDCSGRAIPQKALWGL